MNDDAYDRAQARLARFLERDHSAVGQAGRTLVFDHGRYMAYSTLLFHGLAAGPQQFAEIARALHERGHNVIVPRLPRHGYGDRLSEALATMTVSQLKACAVDSLEIARGLGERVCVAGFSLGALLAAHLGQFQRFSRVVAISPFLGVVLVPDFMRLHLANWLLRRPNRFYWWDPLLRERQLPEHGYPRYATHALAQGLLLAQELLDASEMSAPQAQELVLAINPHDPAVNNAAIERLLRQWRRRRPAGVQVHRFTGLPFAHDIIEPKRYPRIAQRVGPVVVDLIAR